MDEVNLDNIFAEAEIDTSARVEKVPAKKGTEKKNLGLGSGTGPVSEKAVGKSHSGGKPASEKQKPQQIKSPAGKPSSSLKLSTEPSSKEARKRGHAVAVTDDAGTLKKQKQWQEERKTEKGKGKATMVDFEACIRVGQTGAEVFKELHELVAGKMTDHLRAYSEDNRGLKAELQKLKGVQQQLEEANANVSEQTKTIAEIPTLKADLKAFQDRLVAAESKKEESAKLIEQLKKEKADLTVKMAKVAKTGFDRCLNMAVILEPTLNTDLLDAKYKAENGKIVYQGQVIYDPASVISQGIEDEANPAYADQGVELEGEREAEKDPEKAE